MQIFCKLVTLSLISKLFTNVNTKTLISLKKLMINIVLYQYFIVFLNIYLFIFISRYKYKFGNNERIKIE